MPDKDGAEEKTTKSVVSKRQKQMMGEEGYDIARDMGRVRPSKDKKDATTMPPSKEMEKTRKVNKGPSALDIVKKKYKGQIMDVKKEELDLTQVAEAFGGYIIEQEFSDKQKADMVKMMNRMFGTAAQAETTAKKAVSDAPIDDLQKDQEATRKSIERNIKKQQKKDPIISKNVKQGEKILKNIKSNQSKGPNQNPEYQKLLNQQRRRQQAYDAYDDSDAGRPETGNTLNNTKNTNKNQQKFDQMFKGVRKRQSGEKPVIDDPFGETKTKTKTKTKPLPSPEKINTKTKSGKVTGDVESDFVGPKRARSKTATQNRTLQKIKVASRSAKRPVQRLVKPAGSALAKTAKFAGKNPFATLVGASVAKDTFFPVKIPKPPTVQGGKVGRRTAG